METTDGWISQPNICRCCLSTCGTWDMTASYITEEGNEEIFVDILQDCYGITLSYLTERGRSRMVCGLCADHLRDASSFKKQILHAEERFNTYCQTKQDLNSLVIKNESEQIGDESPNFNDPGIDIGDDKETHKENTKTHRLSKNTKKSHSTLSTYKRKNSKTVLKLTRKTKNIIEDIDSDTPISQLSNKNKMKCIVNKNSRIIDFEGSIRKAVDGDSVSVINKGPQQNCLKPVSERKRVMLTCDAVLRDTTACPFRHHKSWFQCFFCQQDFMEINLLRNHTLAKHPNIDDELKKIKRYPRSLQIEISTLICRHCDLNLTDVDTMRRHFVEVHEKIIYNECIADYKVDCSPYSCHLCDQSFHVFRTLTTHLNEHYANCICDVCGKSFLNSKRLKVHKHTHESGQFPCNECGKILKTKTSKANHMESAHSKRIIKCQICFKPMKHYNDRIKHMSEVHDITHKFKCPICGREYNIKHYLATHIRQTHGHKNKKCVECGMAFITNHGLKKHMLKHTGVKPFTCSVCGKSYARSYTLREHMRAHGGERRRAGSEVT